MLKRHLMFAVSGHGFGHMAQVSSILPWLVGRDDLRITVRTPLATDEARRFCGEQVGIVPLHPETGMAMHDAVTVDVDRSHAGYAALHDDWERLLNEECRLLSDERPDLIVADVPYLVLAAAKRVGIPAWAVCSLNWADIYRHYCSAMPGSDRILFDMRDAYGSVEQFLLPEPSMPTGWIARRRSVGVLARRGRSRRNELIETGLIDREDRLVIVALGGIPTRIDGSSIRAAEATRLLMPTAWQPDRSAGQLAIESLQIPFIDLLASCDVVVAKSGYGTFCEAACNGTALIHPPRPDWPEAPFLESWLMQNGRCETIDSLNALYDNRLAESIDQVCAKPLPVRTPEAAGGEEVAGLILERLGLGACRTLDESAAKAG